MNREIHNTIEPVVGFDTILINSDTTTAGNIIDLQAFDAGEYIIQAGIITTGVFTPLIEEGDDSGLSDASAVADSDLTTTEADAVVDATNEIKRIGYTGSKRFLRLSIVSTGGTANGTVGASFIKALPSGAPTAAN